MVLTCNRDQQFCDIRFVCVGFSLFLAWQKFIHQLRYLDITFWYYCRVTVHIIHKNKIHEHAVSTGEFLAVK